MGSSGSKRICRCQSAYATGAIAIGVPGCPEFACCTASIASVRMVFTQSVSSEVSVIVAPVPGGGGARGRRRAPSSPSDARRRVLPPSRRGSIHGRARRATRGPPDHVAEAPLVCRELPVRVHEPLPAEEEELVLGSRGIE